MHIGYNIEVQSIMNRLLRLLLIVAPFTLSGCLPNSNSSGSGLGPDDTTNTSDIGGDSNTDTDTDDGREDPTDVEDNSNIASITLNPRELEVQVGKTSDSVTVKFHLKDESAPYENTVKWSIDNTNIASVDQYGRVTGKASGTASLKCITDDGGKVGYTKVYVYPAGGSVTKAWKRIESDSDLAPGDQLLFADPTSSKLATTDCTGMYLHTVSATFSSDKSTVSGISVAAQFILGEDYKDRGGYTLEVPEREDGTYLATTHTGKVSFYKSVNSSATLWDIAYDTSEHCWDIRSHTTVDGWFMYNADRDLFTTYESNETTLMRVVSLYRLTRV